MEEIDTDIIEKMENKDKEKEIIDIKYIDKIPEEIKTIVGNKLPSTVGDFRNAFPLDISDKLGNEHKIIVCVEPKAWYHSPPIWHICKFYQYSNDPTLEERNVHDMFRKEDYKWETWAIPRSYTCTCDERWTLHHWTPWENDFLAAWRNTDVEWLPPDRRNFWIGYARALWLL
jgi:hypothetical protein